MKSDSKSRPAHKGHKPSTRVSHDKGSHASSHTKTSSSAGASVDARKKTTKCADCGQIGHWRGDAVCPKVKAGQTPPHKGKPRVHWIGMATMGLLVPCHLQTAS